MANLEKFNENPQNQLLEHVKNARCVMLGTPNTDAHMQPMSPRVCLDDGLIFFYADNTSDLGRAVINEPGFVHLCHIENDYQACVKGYLITHDDRDTVERFWSPVVSAWFPDGKTDKKLMMLKFVPHDAALWASDKNMLTFAYEVAKANIKDQKPNIGEKAHIDMQA